MQLSREELLRAYRQMKTIREFEERLHVEITTGEIAGFTHLYAGQEAVAVGVCENLNDSDYIISTHRGHGHCIAKGCDVKGMMKEIYGRKDGLCGGKGGSMHIADVSKGMLGANGIVGGGPPIALGAAMAAKIDGTGAVSVAFGGDGSCNQGTVFEAMNMAVVLQSPIIFVFENNGYSEHTGADYAVGSGDIAGRAAGFGMPAACGDGSDFFEVHAMTREAVERARDGGGPTTLEFKTTRFFGHFEGDPQRYRAKDEVKKHRETMDALKIFRDKVTKAKLLTKKAMDEIDAEVLKLIDEAVEEARAAPPPTPDDLLTDVYISYEGGIQ
ncbi:MAG: thiamine pyrophosphate-dependent dehydrogenase E1 component subunit alpha [Alphaproteobacteria bacterium]|nr:MAG: thiamine pyrophosphate-dependent dehydrogenase E1 component subunit alpha [Alphaproteobacteria bacterium]